MGVDHAEPLEDVLSEVFEHLFRQVHTCLPGRVERYYSEDQTADILPMVKAIRVDETGETVAESYPVLPRVPILHPRGGGFFVHFPLAAGDFCMLVFQEAAIDQWRAKGSESDPVDLRRHALGNAVAYPGLYPTAGKLATASAHATNLVVGREGGQTIHIQPGAGGEIRLGSASETSYVALAELVDARISALQSALDAFVTVFNSHIHITTATVGAGPTPGVISPTATPATPAGTQAPTAATKVTAL